MAQLRVELTNSRGLIGLALLGTKNPGAHHRGHRHRDEIAAEKCCRNYDRQAPHELPRSASDRQHGDKRADGSQRRRENRPAKPVGTFDRRLLSGHPLIHQTLRVVRYDDRVVDDHTEHNDE